MINLGDAMLANDALAELKERLTSLFESEGCPDGMQAVFRHESGELHCRLVVFLTEDFQRVAKLESASRCSLPHASDFGYLAGSEF